MKPTQRILKVFIFLFCVLAIKPVMAQNVGISTTSSFTPDASAALDISYTNKGLLVPRVALTATNAAGPITSPATSLLVYNTATAGTSPNNVIPGYYYWNGSAWVILLTSTQNATTSWLTAGNAGTNPSTNFLGTTDNKPLRFRTNNTQRFLLDSLGNAAIGLSPTFSSNAEKLLVDAGTTSSFNVISGKGNLNNYLQLNIQNNNAGTNASSDVVATADNGNETQNYVDMGINSSANTAAFFGGINDAYLYNAGGTASGGNLFIGTSTSGKVLGFMTGGGATTNERMRIDGTGNVGIANVAPTEKLDVTGNLKFSGALMPNNSAGTSGNFLQSAGAGAPPIWFNAGTLVTSQAWSLLGNSGTNTSTNFLGTTDNKPMRFRTNNTQRLLLDSLGNVAIGLSPTFSSNAEKLLVDAGTTSSFNVISGKGNLNNYLQLNIQNNNAGTNASSDVVATADNGNETLNYVDMGINSSANTAAFFGGINDAYLYNAGGTASGGNLFIGTSTSGKVLGFMTGGGATTNERMRIDGSGNVGIGTTAPAQLLDVNGSINAAGSVYVDVNATNSGTKTPGIVLGGTGSGETISSKRNVGTNQYGIDFYTSSILRMSVTNNGNVGIGTTSPSTKLHIVGTNPLTLNGVQTGTNTSTDSLLTLSSGLVRKLPLSNFAAASNAWSTTGNAGTVYNLNFLGTTDNQSLRFKTNNTQRMLLDSVGRVGIGTNTPTSDLTLFQSSGTGTSRGFKFLGNAVGGGPNTGSGFLFTLGYNATNNKQIWFGDADAAGSNASTFLRIAAGTSGLPTLDAISGDNNSRRFLALGTGGDPNGGVLFGNNSTTTTPSSFVWDNGNMAIGTGYRGNAAPGNGLLVQGNVGVATTTVNSTFDVNGSVGAAITTTSASITLDATNHTVILTSGTPTVTLPAAASTNTRRIYVIVNETASAVTISSYIAFSGSAATTIAANSAIIIQSNGTNWYQIN